MLRESDHVGEFNSTPQFKAGTRTHPDNSDSDLALFDFKLTPNIWMDGWMDLWVGGWMKGNLFT